MMRRFILILALVVSVTAMPRAGSRITQTTAAANVPRRVISLVPSVTEMLFAIGGADAVVGVSSFDHYPPEVEQKARVGGLLDPDFERILSLRPDLVIVYGTQDELIGRLERAGIPVFRYEHAGLSDVTTTLRQIGSRTGHAASAGSLAADIERRLRDLAAKTAPRPRPKTMLVFEREAGSLRGIYASGGVGFLHDMLTIAGGDDVFADVKRQNVQVTTEQVLAKMPEVILEIRAGPGWTPERIASERRVWRVLSSLPAVRNDRIYILTDEMLSVPGPRVADATLAIAKALHPELFR
jgi:iron complex transport system substrate-binding protein